MQIRALLDSRLSRFSPTTVYLVGVGDGLILVALVFLAGFIISKVTH